MEVTIDQVTAQLAPAQAEAPSARAAAPQGKAQQLTKTEQPELSFMTRRERVRARLRTF